MTVRHKRTHLGLRGINPRIGGGNVNALGVGLDPGTEAGHEAYMGGDPQSSSPRFHGEGDRSRSKWWRGIATNEAR